MASNLAGAQAPAQPKSVSAVAIGAIASLIASALSFWGSRWAQRRNEQLTQSQNQWNMDMWQLQNQYNLPSNQVARLKAAGLNPALIYGNGGIQNESADVAPAADYHNVQNPAAGIQSPIDPKTGAEIDLLKAQAARLRTQNVIDQGNLENEQYRTLILQQNADTAAHDVDAKIRDIDNLIFNRNRRFDLDKDMQEFTKNVKQEELKQAWQQIHINEENLRATLEMLPFMKRESMERVNLLVAQAAKASKETEILELNRQYEQLMADLRKNFKADYEAYVTGSWSASTAESGFLTQQYINLRENAESPFWFWCYRVLTGGAVTNAAGAGLTLAQILKMIPK